MAELINESDISRAWLAAFESILKAGGKRVNLVVAFPAAATEQPDIRRILDDFMRSRRSYGFLPITTVANTIFPSSLYIPRLAEAARQHLYDTFADGRTVRWRHSANHHGTYFDRLVAWPGADGSQVNQLERIINRLQSERRKPNPLSSIYELAISIPSLAVDREASFHLDQENVDLDLRIYTPGVDKRTRGFPCLSHISLTLEDPFIHLTATYRNQHFLRKAYGNYLGLSRLLSFICQETGCSPGEIACVATHADAEVGQARGLGWTELRTLVAQCRQADVSEVAMAG